MYVCNNNIVIFCCLFLSVPSPQDDEKVFMTFHCYMEIFQICCLLAISYTVIVLTGIV